MAINPNSKSHFTASKTEPKTPVKKALDNTTLNAEIASNVNKKMVGIWEKSKVDLTRQRNITVNKETVLSPQIKSDLYEGKADENITEYLERKIFDAILKASNGDETLAQKTTNLIQQNVATEALMESFPKVTEEKGWRKINSFHDINIKDGKVEVTQELLYQTFSKDDPEDNSLNTYFKAKLIVAGDAKDIKQGNIDKINVKFVTTDEARVEEKVRKASYPIFKAFPDLGTHFT